MAGYKQLTLLHSNDMHGDFLAQQIDDKLIGGVSRLSGYIARVRAEQPNTLYCIAGDMFRGSVIDAEYRGLSTIEIMNMLSPDVVSLGNHETDYGVGHLLFLEKCAQFPIINANMFITINHTRLFRPYLIRQIGGVKILFIGILTEDVIAQTKNDGVIGSFVDVGDAVEEVGRICNAYSAIDIDLTVLLTHIGFEEDKKLAARLDPAWGVDIIIGGHSHTLMTEPEKVNGVLIAQAGTGTDQIGRFDLQIDTGRNCVAGWRWQCVPIDSAHCPADEALEELITGYKNRTDAKYARLITRFARRLTHPGKTQATDLGGLFADALRESLGLDVMLLASGSVRVPALGPLVLLSDLTEAFPYDDGADVLRVTGVQLRRMLAYMLSDEVWTGVHCEFYQLSSPLRAEYDRQARTFRSLTYDGAPIRDDDVFTLGLQHYHFMNLKSIFNVTQEELEQNGPAFVAATSCRQVLEEYLSCHGNLDRRAEDRLIVV